MKDRQKNLLNLIIDQHIKTAAPVGSKLLSSAENKSPATIRNQMSELEKQGYIYQPHTSAGRVPTEKGYQFYIDNYIPKKNISSTWRKSFAQVLKAKVDKDQVLKNIAKTAVELADQTVIVAFNKNNIYYTGISNLFKKPEFAEQNVICNVSEIIDHLDDKVSKIFDQIDNVQVLIGKNNPFGEDCSSVIGRYQLKNKQTGLFIILGPKRMDYGKNLALVEYIKDSLNKI